MSFPGHDRGPTATGAGLLPDLTGIRKAGCSRTRTHQMHEKRGIAPRPLARAMLATARAENRGRQSDLKVSREDSPPPCPSAGIRQQSAEAILTRHARIGRAAVSEVRQAGPLW